METPLGKGVDGLAGIVAEKWFAAMGLVGLLLFVTTFVVAVPGDPVVARCIGLMMMGWGFGQADCRTFRITIANGHKFTARAWKLTTSGALLFAVAFAAATYLVWYLRH